MDSLMNINLGGWEGNIACSCCEVEVTKQNENDKVLMTQKGQQDENATEKAVQEILCKA